MSENSAKRVLEEGQNRAFDDGWIRASDPRPLLAATSAAHDGGFTEVPGTGYGPAAELSTAFHRIMDRGVLRHTEAQPVREELARHERPSARPGQGGRTIRVDDVSRFLHVLAASAADATRVLEAVAAAGLTQRIDPHDRIHRLRGARLHGARLHGARLHGAGLSSARLSGVVRDYKADDLPSPVRHTARVATAVAQLEARDGSVPEPVVPGPSTTGEAAVPPTTE
ncbi:pentapeptide repeat-containing protein [Streptomyces sp. NPDC088358]|uniref:pentapeptide repeat-containing protein n=1 Tax=Streptomyces sp. NPDC088358 TaxID=3365857 RepID=UPI0038126907